MIWLGWRTNAAVPFPPIHFGVNACSFRRRQNRRYTACHRHIEPERVPFFDFRYMTHHRTPMEGRLSVKQHCVSVHHVSMNHVAVFQINGVSVDVSQRVLTPFLRSSILHPEGVWTVLYQHRQKITVHVINRNWFREIHRYFMGTPSCFIDRPGSPVITERAL
jgi:hypothetical protein